MTTQEPIIAADMELVRQFARGGSNEAFSALVSRYVNLVYSVAIRQVGDPHLAEEATQSVFIILSQKAGSLGSKTILSGWLCRTARNVAANALTVQHRRQHREQEAYMQAASDDPEAESDAWKQIAPHLDAAMAQLGEKNHDAVVLRFFDGKDLKEVGAALGVSEEAAKKRVARGVEKLRHFFHKRGIVVPVSVLVAAITANSVQAAPAGFLPVAVSATAASGGSTLTFLKIIAMTKLKIGIIAAMLVATAATTAVVIFHRPGIKLSALPSPNGYQNFIQAARDLPGDASNYRQMSPAALRSVVEQDAATLALVRQGFEHECRVADNFSTNIDILGRLKNLTYVFSAEGRLAELENRPEDAIHSYLDNLRYGQESSRGGTVIHRLVGMSIETTALRSLEPLTNTADVGQCKEIAGALENFDAKEPPVAETLEQEKAYREHFTRGLGDVVAQTMMAKALEAGIQSFVRKEQTNQFTLRQTMIAFAARAYQLDKKQAPASVADLTPEYLKNIPQDPRTGQ